MTIMDRQMVTEKYDELSRLETTDERREFINKQSDEMRVALWLENIERKTKGSELSTEQKEIIEVIKEKFITVNFAEFARGKSEEQAGTEYQEVMSKAARLLGKDHLRELFGVLGDSRTLKPGC